VTDRPEATTDSGDAGTGTSVVRGRVEELAHSPVFVDSTGRRRTWVTWTLGVVAGACVGYLALLGLSFAGGPVTPKQLLPLPGVPDRGVHGADVSGSEGGGASTASGTPGSGGSVPVPLPLGATGSAPASVTATTPATGTRTTSPPTSATSSTLPVPPVPTTIPTSPSGVPTTIPTPSTVLPPATPPVPVGG
jgi:hypothetical protein